MIINSLEKLYFISKINPGPRKYLYVINSTIRYNSNVSNEELA